MTDQTNGAAAAPPRLQILTQYIRDMSFENIAAQKGMAPDGRPDIKVQVNIDAQKRTDDRFEVALKVKVDSKVAEAGRLHSRAGLRRAFPH